MTTEPFREHAPELAKRGFAVFPVSEGGKIPLAGSHGQRDATTDPVQVARWAKLHPRANVAVRPDPDVVVIDVDDPEAAQAWRLEHGLPRLRTRTVKTRKGYHFYVRVNEELVDGRRWRARLDWGDLKRSNGYAVGPGSVVSGVTYRLQRDLPVADLPAAWYGPLLWPKKPQPIKGDIGAGAETADVNAPMSNRAAGLVRILGTLREGDGRRARYLRFVGLAYRIHGGNRALLRNLRSTAERIGLDPHDLDSIDAYLASEHAGGTQ